MNALVQHFFDPVTSTFSYVLHAGPNTACAVIDAVCDYNDNNARTGTTLADEIIDFIQNNQLSLEWILETHIHADHLSAASYIKQHLGGKIGASIQINAVSNTFSKALSICEADAGPNVFFDHFFDPDETFKVGDLKVSALHVPGHTSADMAFYVENTLVFVGDTLFAPDVGTARCDFPGGSAKQLWSSIQKILALPGSTRMFLCHDYPPDNRRPRCEFTIDEQLASNIHVQEGTAEEEFIALREARDQQLGLPQLLVPSLQTNLRAGQLPVAEKNGISYIKVPLNYF